MGILSSCTSVSTNVWLQHQNSRKMIGEKLYRIMCAVLNRFSKQHFEKPAVLRLFASISNIIKVRHTRHAGHYHGVKSESYVTKPINKKFHSSHVGRYLVPLKQLTR